MYQNGIQGVDILVYYFAPSVIFSFLTDAVFLCIGRKYKKSPEESEAQQLDQEYTTLWFSILLTLVLCVGWSATIVSPWLFCIAIPVSPIAYAHFVGIIDNRLGYSVITGRTFKYCSSANLFRTNEINIDEVEKTYFVGFIQHGFILLKMTNGGFKIIVGPLRTSGILDEIAIERGN